jgi:hypothetical protein
MIKIDDDLISYHVKFVYSVRSGILMDYATDIVNEDNELPERR